MGNRREFLAGTVAAGVGSWGGAGWAAWDAAGLALEDETLRKDWLARWEKGILRDAQSMYCDREMGEQIGWLVSHFLSGFYYGYRATGELKWVEHLVRWADAWIRRGVKEPDGFIGWPKADGASTSVMAGLFTDNMLGEAMGLRPLVLLADAILKSQEPVLKDKQATAQEYLRLAEQVFEKWDSRGCWRDVPVGGVWVVPPFGIDQKTGGWTEGYAQRKTDGFTLPPNKQNHIACWLLALADATGKAIYRERAEKWWRQMKSRFHPREQGKYLVWNYWDPAGPWDYKSGSATKHWVGVHPNGGYYGIDVEGIATAYEHGLVFGKDEIDRLIATNRDFMWNHQVQGAQFQRIDGGRPDSRWAKTPGVLWTALVPHDETLRKIFVANHKPDSWGGLITTPWYFSCSQKKSLERHIG